MSETLCSYPLLSWLAPGQSARCRAENGREITLKLLDRDCLLEGNLHPDVRDRLGRIRELALSQVATLIGVERDPQQRVWMVWEFIQGQDLHTWACDPAREQLQLVQLLRELVLALEALHAQGIIHGNLTPANIVIDSTRGLHLLDLSPLLYTDEQEDIRKLQEIFAQIITCRAAEDSELARILRPLLERPTTLRELSAALSRLLAPAGTLHPGVSRDEQAHRFRRRARGALLAALLLSTLLASVSWYFLNRRYGPPKPAEAPPEALQQRK